MLFLASQIVLDGVWKEAVGKLDNQPAYYFAARKRLIEPEPGFSS